MDFDHGPAESGVPFEVTTIDIDENNEGITGEYELAIRDDLLKTYPFEGTVEFDDGSLVENEEIWLVLHVVDAAHPVTIYLDGEKVDDEVVDVGKATYNRHASWLTVRDEVVDVGDDAELNIYFRADDWPLRNSALAGAVYVSSDRDVDSATFYAKGWVDVDAESWVDIRTTIEKGDLEDPGMDILAAGWDFYCEDEGWEPYDGNVYTLGNQRIDFHLTSEVAGTAEIEVRTAGDNPSPGELVGEGEVTFTRVVDVDSVDLDAPTEVRAGRTFTLEALVQSRGVAVEDEDVTFYESDEMENGEWVNWEEIDTIATDEDGEAELDVVREEAGDTSNRSRRR